MGIKKSHQPLKSSCHALNDKLLHKSNKLTKPKKMIPEFSKLQDLSIV